MLESKHKSLGHLIFCTGVTCGEGDAQSLFGKLRQAWIRNRLYSTFYLSFADCLGPCDLPRNAFVNTGSTSFYLGKLEEEQIRNIISWALDCKNKGTIEGLPPSLRTHRLDRFLN